MYAFRLTDWTDDYRGEGIRRERSTLQKFNIKWRIYDREGCKIDKKVKQAYNFSLYHLIWDNQKMQEKL